MDDLFGQQNFRNEIVWEYRTGGSSKKSFSKKHDIILFYTKNNIYTFNPQKEKSYTKSKSRKPGIINYGGGTAEFFQDESGVFNYVNMRDIWEISYVGSTSPERTGYPTQKPLELLERIIKASSKEGDIVLDPFCGCATACVAAERLQRQWIGIDISPSAEVITKIRLEEASQQSALFSPVQMSDVTVTSTSPERTDNAEEIAIQQRLPTYQTHKPELFGKQQGRCNGCGYEFHYRNLSIDHIKPRSKGIDNRIENLQLLCTSCNSKKGTGTQEELIQKLKDEKIISAY